MQPISTSPERTANGIIKLLNFNNIKQMRREAKKKVIERYKNNKIYKNELLKNINEAYKNNNWFFFFVTYIC